MLMSAAVSERRRCPGGNVDRRSRAGDIDRFGDGGSTRRVIPAASSSVVTCIGRETRPSGRMTTNTRGGATGSAHSNLPSGPVRADPRWPTMVTSAFAIGARRASVDDLSAERQCRCGDRQSEKEEGADASQHAAKSNSEDLRDRGFLLQCLSLPETQLDGTTTRRPSLACSRGANCCRLVRLASRRWVQPARHPLAKGSRRRDRDRAQRPPEPPAPETIANPATMRVEDWSEPWVWRPEEWPGQPLTLQIVGNRHLPRAVAPGNRFTPLYSFNGASPGPTIRTRGDARSAREGAKHARPESRTGAERSDAGSVRDSARRSRGRALRDIEGPGYGMLHAADAGPRAPRRDPSLHSSHARGHELPFQSCKRAAWIAHDEPAHARRARPAGNESEWHARGQHVPSHSAER